MSTLIVSTVFYGRNTKGKGPPHFLLPPAKTFYKSMNNCLRKFKYFVNICLKWTLETCLMLTLSPIRRFLGTFITSSLTGSVTLPKLFKWKFKIQPKLKMLSSRNILFRQRFCHPSSSHPASNCFVVRYFVSLLRRLSAIINSFPSTSTIFMNPG